MSTQMSEQEVREKFAAAFKEGILIFAKEANLSETDLGKVTDLIMEQLGIANASENNVDK